MIQAFLANPAVSIGLAASGSGFSMTVPEFSARLDQSILLQPDTTLNDSETTLLRDHMVHLGLQWGFATEEGTARGLLTVFKNDEFLARATESERAEALESFVTDFLDVLDDPATRPQLSVPGQELSSPNEDRFVSVGGGIGMAAYGIKVHPNFMAPSSMSEIAYKTIENPALPGLRSEALALYQVPGRYLDEAGEDGPHVRRAESYDDLIFGGVPMVKMVPERGPSPIELTLFGDSTGVMPRDARGLEKMAAFIRDFDLDELSAEQAPAILELARVLYQISDEQMAQAQTRRASRFLEYAVTLLSAWQNREGMSETDLTRFRLAAATIEAWEHRMNYWEELSRRLESATATIHGAAAPARQGNYDETTLILMDAARIVFGVAESYQKMGYSVLAHHVMHTQCHPVLDAAQECSDQVARMLVGQQKHDPRIKEELASLHDKAEKFHEQMHRTMFDSSEWVPVRDEGGDIIYRPDAISVRNMVLSLEVYLGLEPTDREEFYDPAEEVGVSKPVFDMTAHFYTSGKTLKRIEARYKEADSAQGYQELINLLNIFDRVHAQIRLAVRTLGNDMPDYLSRVMHALRQYVRDTKQQWYDALPAEEKPEMIMREVADRLSETAHLLNGMGNKEAALNYIAAAIVSLQGAAKFDAAGTEDALQRARQLQAEIRGPDFVATDLASAFRFLTSPRAINLSEALSQSSGYMVGGAWINPSNGAVDDSIVRVEGLDEAMEVLGRKAAEGMGSDPDDSDDE